MIFHIADPSEYTTALSGGTGSYKPAPFDREGFIHCSTATQIAGTLDKHFKALDEVLLLAIDIEAEKEFIRFEDLYGSGHEFPHIYHELPLSSVLDTFLLKRNEPWHFDLPQEWLDRYC